MDEKTVEDEMKVAGVVLAAGRSSRMGRPKALLPIGPGRESFVTRLVTTLALGGVSEVIVVVRDGDEEVRAEIERGVPPGSRVRVITNPNAELGQLSSLQAAITAVGHGGAGLLMVPVDMPLVAPDTVATLLAAFSSTGAAILRAVHRGRHGHPVLFSGAVFDELLTANPDEGARAVVRSHGALDVEVDDPGVVEDVDTPEDYARLFGRELP